MTRGSVQFETCGDVACAQGLEKTVDVGEVKYDCWGSRSRSGPLHCCVRPVMEKSLHFRLHLQPSPFSMQDQLLYCMMSFEKCNCTRMYHLNFTWTLQLNLTYMFLTVCGITMFIVRKAVHLP